MSSWRVHKLSEIADFTNGKSIKASDEGEYPVYGANGQIGYSDDSKFENSSIVGRVGAYCGATTFEEGKFWASDNTIVVKNLTEGSTPYFLYYLLKNLNLNNYAHGSAQPLLTQTFIKSMKVKVPTLDLQRKSAKVIKNYDDLINSNDRRIKILEEMAQAIYTEWFVNFRFPGYEDVEFVDSKLGKIPNTWQIKNLQELVDTQYGYTEKSQDEEVGPHYIRGTDINKTTFINWSDVPYCEIDDEDLSKFKTRVGDILVIRMADPGKPAIIESEQNSVFASYLIRLTRRSDALTPYYLFYFLLSDRYQGYISGASTGSTRRSASASVLTDIDILIPDERFLQDFDSQVIPIRKLITSLVERNNVLSKTRDILIPKLISGEIDVSELDIYVEEEND